MQLIEEKIRTIVNESIRQILIERLIKVLSKMPNVEPIDHIKRSKHFKKERQTRANIIGNLGGYGNPIASFLVFDYDSNTEKIHTITDNGICFVQDKDTKKIITIFPITFDRVKDYWKQLTNKDNPKLPKDIWNRRHDIRSFYSRFRNTDNALKVKKP